MMKMRIILVLYLACGIISVCAVSGYCDMGAAAISQDALQNKESPAAPGEKATTESTRGAGIMRSFISMFQNKSIHVDKGTLWGDGDIPGWLKRTDFGIDAGTQEITRYYFETLQPVYQDEEEQNTVFGAGRYSFQERDATYNLGLGYRRLLFENSVLLGVNSFWDARSNHSHYRMGLGGEAFIKMIELRANGYFPFSPRRRVSEDSAYLIWEQAVSGFDVEGGLPIPYLNWISCYGGAYRYDYKYAKDKYGWTVRTQVKPFKYGTTNFIVYGDNKLDDPAFRVDGYITIPWEFFFERQKASEILTMGISKTMYPSRIDHSNKVLQRVERSYKVEVESWAESKITGATIEVKRGN